jgi:hypothetical protein
VPGWLPPVDFDPRVRLEFRGTQLSSDGGLLVMRELDDALGLSGLASAALCDMRRGKNTVHRLDGLFRQSVYGRLWATPQPLTAANTRLSPPRPEALGECRVISTLHDLIFVSTKPAEGHSTCTVSTWATEL